MAIYRTKRLPVTRELIKDELVWFAHREVLVVLRCLTCQGYETYELDRIPTEHECGGYLWEIDKVLEAIGVPHH